MVVNLIINLCTITKYLPTVIGTWPIDEGFLNFILVGHCHTIGMDL